MTPPLTPDQRAKEILLMAIDQTRVDWNEHGKKKLKFIANQIREAEKEARAEGNSYKLSYWKKREEEAYAQGFSDAVEQVVKIVYYDDVLLTPDEFEDKIKLKVFEMLDRIKIKIRALRPSGRVGEGT